MNEEVKKLVNLIKYENGITQQEVAKLAGVNPQYLSGVINGRYPFSSELRKTLHELCSYEDGEGDTLASSKEEQSKEGQSKKSGIPIYRDARFGCSPSGFVGAIEERTADDDILVPGLKNDGRTFVVVARGESMVNKANPSQSIPNGAFVAIEKSTLSSPQWGETYALSTDDGCIIKRLYPSEHDGCVKCVSFNETEFPCFELHTSEIHDIGIVKAVMTVNIWK